MNLALKMKKRDESSTERCITIVQMTHEDKRSKMKILKGR